MKKTRTYWLVVLFLAIILIFGLIYLWPIFKISQERPDDTSRARIAPAQKINRAPPGFRLIIPKLKIQVPIIAKVEGSNKERYLKALEKGVAHYAGTALPGENGNIFIFGHSNFFWDQPGRYKKIFARLDQLKPGDRVKLHYQQREYRYLVSKTKLIDPDQVQFLRQTKKERLTLMTCWPPGAIEKRLIVICRKIED